MNNPTPQKLRLASGKTQPIGSEPPQGEELALELRGAAFLSDRSEWFDPDGWGSPIDFEVGERYLLVTEKQQR